MQAQQLGNSEKTRQATNLDQFLNRFQELNNRLSTITCNYRALGNRLENDPPNDAEKSVEKVQPFSNGILLGLEEHLYEMERYINQLTAIEEKMSGHI